MPKFIIEREIPGAGTMSAEELRGAAQHSNSVIQKLGPDIRWEHSYVTGDKIFCVYESPNEDLIRAHAKESGFPANIITPVIAVIGPTSAQ
ncbi:MAG TPA: DUF4242 domain-containing protein [Burkholderiaceae bacterium]